MGNLSDVRQDAVEIELRDGTKMELLYTLNAVADLEEAYGDVNKALKALDDGSVIAIRKILYCGLVDTKGMSEREFGDMLLLKDMDGYGSAIAQAISGASPQEVEDYMEEAKAKAVKNAALVGAEAKN